MKKLSFSEFRQKTIDFVGVYSTKKVANEQLKELTPHYNHKLKIEETKSGDFAIVLKRE